MMQYGKTIANVLLDYRCQQRHFGTLLVAFACSVAMPMSFGPLIGLWPRQPHWP
jgi:hypothetical protein